MQFKKRAVSSAPCVVDGGVCPDSGAGHSRLAGLAQGGPLPSEAGGGRRQVGIFLLPWLPLISGFCVTTWAQEPARLREALPRGGGGRGRPAGCVRQGAGCGKVPGCPRGPEQGSGQDLPRLPSQATPSWLLPRTLPSQGPLRPPPLPQAERPVEGTPTACRRTSSPSPRPGVCTPRSSLVS